MSESEGPEFELDDEEADELDESVSGSLAASSLGAADRAGALFGLAALPLLLALGLDFALDLDPTFAFAFASALGSARIRLELGRPAPLLAASRSCASAICSSFRTTSGGAGKADSLLFKTCNGKALPGCNGMAQCDDLVGCTGA